MASKCCVCTSFILATLLVGFMLLCASVVPSRNYRVMSTPSSALALPPSNCCIPLAASAAAPRQHACVPRERPTVRLVAMSISSAVSWSLDLLVVFTRSLVVSQSSQCGGRLVHCNRDPHGRERIGESFLPTQVGAP
jgi:hypothetical protein